MTQWQWHWSLAIAKQNWV